VNPDPALVETLRAVMHETPLSHTFTPLLTFDKADNERDCESLGWQLLQEGKCACLVVAGGQGSRLNFSGPKGAFPFSSVKNKSFFELLADRCRAASARVNRPIPLVIMTSEENRHETEDFFRSHHLFGLIPEQLHFYTQGSLPQLTEEGELAKNAQGEVIYGPDGNGGALKSFVESGVASTLQKQGVEYFTFHIIDNALADPFDPLLFGFHAKRHADVTVKSVSRINSEEKVGVLVVENGKTAVKEYSEISISSDAYSLANISLYCFSLSFAFYVAQMNMPIHKAFKKSLWKFEYFIFDLLAFSRKTEVLLYPRASTFAPLKELQDVEIVRQAMQKADQALLFALTGKTYSCQEVDRAFYYLSPSQKEEIKAHPPQDEPYIEFRD
jgi:UDP-N-acetylglucosamine/UDP-N-acetylgalactosamine diphosphorylase